MASIPLDLQKRCEQRWAARFSRPVAPKHRMESQDQQLRRTRQADEEAALAEISKPNCQGGGLILIRLPPEKGGTGVQCAPLGLICSRA